MAKYHKIKSDGTEWRSENGKNWKMINRWKTKGEIKERAKRITEEHQ